MQKTDTAQTRPLTRRERRHRAAIRRREEKKYKKYAAYKKVAAQMERGEGLEMSGGPGGAGACKAVPVTSKDDVATAIQALCGEDMAQQFHEVSMHSKEKLLAWVEENIEKLQPAIDYLENR